MSRAPLILSPLVVLLFYWLALVTAGDGRKIAPQVPAPRRELALLAMPQLMPHVPRRRLPRPKSEARCANAMENAKRLEPDRLDLFGATGIYIELRACRGSHPELEARLRAVEITCRRFVEDELGSDCRQAFFQLRAAAIAFADGESDPDKITDPEVLASRLYLLESFMERDGEWRWREKMELSERLLELQPDNSTAASFLLSGISGLINEEPRAAENEELWLEAERAVRVLDPSTSERVEWEVFVESEGMKNRLLEEAARNAIVDHPGSAMGYYWLAYASARRQDQEEAEEALAEAYAREPQNRRVRSAWEEMRLSHSPSFVFGEAPSAKALLQRVSLDR